MNSCLVIFLCVVSIEYIGIGQYVPVAKHLSLPLSLVSFIWLASKNGLGELFQYKQTNILLCFVILASASLFNAVVKTNVISSLKAQAGYLMLFSVAYFVCKHNRRINIFLVAFVVIHAALVCINMGGTLNVGAYQSGGSERTGVLRAGYFLGDGNDFGWALAIAFPFSLYLFRITSSILKKLIALGMTTLLVAGIVLTQSRGAAIAILSSIAYLVLVSKRKIIALLLVVCIGLLAVTLISPNYIERLNSIRTYEEDSSARGRIMAWKAAIQMAIDNPLGVGAGNFSSAYGRFYRGEFSDPSVWRPNRWISPHSIYFIAVGEFGFLGGILVLLLIFQNLLTVRKAQLLKMTEPGEKHFRLPLLNTLAASLIAFAVGGIFLGGLFYPHIYILSSLIIATSALQNQCFVPSESDTRKSPSEEGQGSIK